MPMTPQSSAVAAAGGAPMQQAPQQPQAQGQVPPGGPVPVQEIINALKQILPQVMDERGYVNMDKLIMMWPQVSKVPFQAVLQLIQKNPEILNQLITQYGLNGIIIQGKVVSADQLAAVGSKGGM